MSTLQRVLVPGATRLREVEEVDSVAPVPPAAFTRPSAAWCLDQLQADNPTGTFRPACKAVAQVVADWAPRWRRRRWRRT